MMALELNDDHETFEAALALIDEWELEIGALPGGAGSSTAGQASPVSSCVTSGDKSSDDCDAQSTTTSASTEDSDDACFSRSRGNSPQELTSRRRKLRSDEEDKVPTQMGRREELVFLRRKVRELEGVLATVKEEHDGPVKQESAEIQAVEQQQRARELDATWVWQQIAARQLEHRQKSEHENLKLRVQVEEQIKIAKDLMRVLMRAYRRDEQEANENREVGSFKRVKTPRDALTEVSEEDQLRRVDELMEESTSVFAVRPFTGGLPVFRDVNVLEHANGESTINVDISWVVPFPVGQVMSAFWTHLMRKTRSDRPCDEIANGRCTAADDGREVLVTRYESNATASKFAGKFFGRFVARRTHPEEDKPGVIIMDMCADPVGFKPMSMEGVRLHNETLMRVIWADQAAGDKAVPSAGRMSLVQMSQRVHVQLAASETPTRRRRVGALTNFLMYNVEAELDWKQDLLETLLMRSAIPSAPM